MKTLIILNRNPYDGTDVSWNALRLAGKLSDLGVDVHIFLVNDAVDMARDVAKPPAGYFDLSKMLKDLIQRGILVKVCGTCKVRCGIYKGQPYFEGAKEATISELAEWVKRADKIISF